MKRYFQIALIALAGIAFLAGCGGSSDDTSTTGTSTTASNSSEGNEEGTNITPPSQRPSFGVKTGFLGKANRLCLKNITVIQKKLKPYFAEAVASGQVAEPDKVVNTIIAPSLETELSQLRALNTPAKYEGKMNAVIVSSESVIAEAKSDPETFMADGTPYSKVEHVAKQTGLEECGHP